ncbi:arginine--tRNA ligase [Mucilaginibacter rubeus]|uniref:Arginine--tRNA ligase n=1 Tax=Mucilaginibacter rubeus TaxID=2027860 RepID=A0AAE6JCL4_9SPHI|nr:MULTISPECIES: arginine--tRNA ligase [Mucilaginibacter]QEM03219.1 arginine--tRNA ligase [Mucilaginibacter rubeus]QEM15838.1 arginine--tRNA ligase [Mucilaginibacter gossypii]QTE41424.1 arginine--tRNA ligase [Mucilaginibacter rubeus]QTE48027.1 arginine--tRNA ligase [Mucilaginibacter rubeus]QTE59421.1 arginine--tRNA ligase [Mucilaginibacter rubeus]
MDFIIEAAVKAVKQLYQTDIEPAAVSIQETRKEFEGQVTIVTFPFTKFSRKGPEQTGTEIGEFLKNELKEVASFNVIKGFLNLSITDEYWIGRLYNNITADDFAVAKPNGQKVMVEYSSPNTNKPLHLGHIRNNLLGYSVAEILAADGYEVIKTNLVNDRGIHICKSMLAWQKFGNGETPESSGMKGDHLVGKYYVLFDKELREQLKPVLSQVYEKHDLSAFKENQKTKIEDSLATIAKVKEKRAQTDEANQKLIGELEDKIAGEDDKIKEIAKNATPIMIETQQMLQKWEAGDEEVMNLWRTMNGWVYAGFAETYKQLGVDFDKYYYESNTYLLGKDIIEEGLAKGVFFKKADNSVWIDLTSDGLDEKLVLRGDGTSVYITQDMGTAQLKYNDYHMDKSIYVVGNEQDYHFKVLFLILQKLGKTGADGLFHLSYGMVDLPSGKMKSREGTVVDADDLMAEMEATAKEQTEAMGKVDAFNEEDKIALYHTIGMGALKYFLLKVDPKKRLLFDPNESVDFQGHTGPFIQYTHARIKSVLSRADYNAELKPVVTELAGVERDLIVLLDKYPETVKEAAKGYSPAVIANYVYELAKTYNKFYHEKSILQAEDEDSKQFRLALSASSAKVISKGMKLLGIEVPERM